MPISRIRRRHALSDRSCAQIATKQRRSFARRKRASPDAARRSAASGQDRLLSQAQVFHRSPSAAGATTHSAAQQTRPARPASTFWIQLVTSLRFLSTSDKNPRSTISCPIVSCSLAIRPSSVLACFPGLKVNGRNRFPPPVFFFGSGWDGRTNQHMELQQPLPLFHLNAASATRALNFNVVLPSSVFRHSCPFSSSLGPALYLSHCLVLRGQS